MFRGIAWRTVLFVGIIFAGASVSAADEPKIIVNTPTNELAPCEPLTLCINYRLPTQAIAQTEFSIEINGKKVSENHTIFPRSFAKERIGEDKSLGFMVELFYDPVQKKCYFEQEGEYKIVVGDQKTGVRSNPLNIRVRPPTPKEKEAVSFFVGNPDRLVTLLTPHEQGRAGTDFEELCAKHGDTVYAAHASCALGMKKFAQITRDVNKRGAIDEYKKIMPYFRRAVGKRPGSALEERAVFHLAWCEALSKQYQLCRKNLASLQANFPQGEYIFKVKSMLKELGAHGF